MQLRDGRAIGVLDGDIDGGAAAVSDMEGFDIALGGGGGGWHHGGGGSAGDSGIGSSGDDGTGGVVHPGGMDIDGTGAAGNDLDEVGGRGEDEHNAGL